MMSFMVNPYVFKAAGPSGPAVVTYEGRKGNTDSVAPTTHTITAVPFGSAAEDRLLVFAVHHIFFAESTKLLTATVAGVPAAILKSHTGPLYSTSGKNGVTFISAKVPTGTSGTVFLTFSAQARAHLGVYRVVQLMADEPTQTAGASIDYAGSKSIQIGVQAGGVMIAAGGVHSANTISISAGVSSQYSAAWFQVGSSSWRGAGGMYSATSDVASRTVTLSKQSDGLNMTGALAAVSFR